MYVSPSVASTARICIDKYENGDWSGKIYTRLNKEPVEFANVGEMLKCLETFWNRIGFPKESTISRRFTEQQRITDETFVKVSHLEDGKKDKIKVELSETDMDKKNGKQDTFIVRIKYRQNATWQGNVTWAEENKTVPFRSALELLKLLDSTQSGQADEWKD